MGAILGAILLSESSDTLTARGRALANFCFERSVGAGLTAERRTDRSQRSYLNSINPNTYSTVCIWIAT